MQNLSSMGVLDTPALMHRFVIVISALGFPACKWFNKKISLKRACAHALIIAVSVRIYKCATSLQPHEVKKKWNLVWYDDKYVLFQQLVQNWIKCHILQHFVLVFTVCPNLILIAKPKKIYLIWCAQLVPPVCALYFYVYLYWNKLYVLRLLINTCSPYPQFLFFPLQIYLKIKKWEKQEYTFFMDSGYVAMNDTPRWTGQADWSINRTGITVWKIYTGNRQKSWATRIFKTNDIF